MFRIAAKLPSRASSTALFSLTAKPSLNSFTRPSPLASSSFFREESTALELDKDMAVPDVVRMCKYALKQARFDKSVGSYGLGYLVLKHCLTTELTEGNDPQHENAKGVALLAMATLMSERRNPGDFEDAIERLQAVQELTHCYLGVKVAAFEALAGLYLEAGKDEMASEVADKCVELVEKNKTEEDFEDLNLRARAVKGLTELVNGNVKSAEAFFDQPPQEYFGTAALSYGEFLQITGNYSKAKEIYRINIEAATNLKDELKESGNSYLGAGNMNFEGTLMAASCALGQLESHLGNYRKAEEHLTTALTAAERTYGEKHPKVAAVLTCMALMYKRKAIDEKSSSLLVEEENEQGLYRRVIGILKVPEAESEGTTPEVDRSDIAALARGLYAKVLGVQENRKEEGEKLKNLAESIWKNRRISLADAVGNTEAKSSFVVDARITRLL